jgi:GTP-binding protein Era
MKNSTHKSGFVALIGKPNAGKSTLINALIGEKLSIITHKPQTTRQSIIGIDDTEDFQIIYTDTPGLIEPAYKLQEYMMRQVNKSIASADVIIVVVDFRDNDIEQALKDRLNELNIPIILAINKTDLHTDNEQTAIMEKWGGTLNQATNILISAITNSNLEELKGYIIKNLPYHPKYYDGDILTDRPVRFIVEEVIREKCLSYYHKEIPYSLEVKVLSFEENDRIIKIHTEIYTEKKSQKHIIIGKSGESIKKIGITAREELEKMLGKKIHLTQIVKVAPEWRRSEATLKKFGYSD